MKQCNVIAKTKHEYSKYGKESCVYCVVRQYVASLFISYKGYPIVGCS